MTDFKALHEELKQEIASTDAAAFYVWACENEDLLLSALETAQQVERLQRECVNWERESEHLQQELGTASTEARNFKTAMEANRDAAMGYQDRALAAERQIQALQSQLAAKERELNPERIRENCHATYNGGHHEPETNAAFHHGMDTVCNVLAAMLDKPKSKRES